MKLVLSVYTVDWIIQTFQIFNFSLNLCKVVFSLQRIYRALQSLQISESLLDVDKAVVSVYIEDGEVERLEICHLSLYVLEVVLVFHSVHWSSQILQIEQILR